MRKNSVDQLKLIGKYSLYIDCDLVKQSNNFVALRQEARTSLPGNVAERLVEIHCSYTGRCLWIGLNSFGRTMSIDHVVRGSK